MNDNIRQLPQSEQRFRKPGEVNSEFGAWCNRVMQVGGAVCVIFALPFAGIVGTVLWQDHNNSVAILAKLGSIEDSLKVKLDKSVFDAEIRRLDASAGSLERKVDGNYAQHVKRFAKHGDLIRVNAGKVMR